MKSIRNPWALSGATVLSLVIAACSSKTTDAGAGGAGNGNTGGVTSAGGTTSNSTSTDTGGRTSTPTNTGGGGFDPATYCNGLFKEQSCSQTQVQADVRTVNMLLVLDESGSMKDSPTSGADSKWTIMKGALNQALPQVAGDINFGLELFPFLPGGIPPGSISPTDNCAVPDDVSVAINVPIGPPGTGTTSLQEVLSTVELQSPAGGTPTTRALQQALAYFTTGDGKNLTGTKWVLLATDGGPNCNLGLTCDAAHCTQNLDCKCGGSCTATDNCCAPSPGGQSNGFVCLDDAATTSQIKQLADVGVKTFVIGVPGTEAYANSLNSFANAGKMPNPNGANGELYYAISATRAQQDLVDVFGTITTQLIHSCDIALKANPPDPNRVNVAIDCASQQPVPVGSPADAGVDGYYIDYTQNPAHLRLVGAPCNSLTTQGAHNVDIIVGCQPIG